MRISDWSSDVCSSDLGGAVDARIDCGDQLVLPRPPLDLPDAQRDEAGRKQQRQHRQQPAFHGCWFMACGIGIMLVFRWCITHSDPASAMPRTMIVKTSEVSDQPTSAFGVMWRKTAMLTTICAHANPMRIYAAPPAHRRRPIH